MSATICPTITATTDTAYDEQMRRVEPFATRLHIDLADGVFAPRKLIALDTLWWPGNKVADLHVMYREPFTHTELFLVQHPNMVIVQAEADGDFLQFATKLHAHGIQVGVALLPRTPVRVITPALHLIDHVLIFSGNLGYQGGSTADFSLLVKVQEIRALKKAVEIGWDGGVNADNAARLLRSGIDVLNVGGFIQRAGSPARAYATLEALA